MMAWHIVAISVLIIGLIVNIIRLGKESESFYRSLSIGEKINEEQNKQLNKEIKERIERLENQMCWKDSFDIANGKSLIELRIEYNKLKERVEKLERKKTSTKK